MLSTLQNDFTGESYTVRYWHKVYGSCTASTEKTPSMRKGEISSFVEKYCTWGNALPEIFWTLRIAFYCYSLFIV